MPSLLNGPPSALLYFHFVDLRASDTRHNYARGLISQRMTLRIFMRFGCILRLPQIAGHGGEASPTSSRQTECLSPGR